MVLMNSYEGIVTDAILNNKTIDILEVVMFDVLIDLPNWGLKLI